MAEKAILIDTSLCMGCRGCQVACKQWWQQGVEETTCTGSYQNPPDASYITWSLLRFAEAEVDGKVKWYFAKDQCRHCADAPCAMACPHGDKVVSKNEYGGVVFDQSQCGDCDTECVKYCPYSIPKAEGDFCRASKCRMCDDRVAAGGVPACAKTCPTGALSFGNKDDIVAQAEARVAALGGDANIYPNTDGNAMWVLLAANTDYELASHTPRELPGQQKPKEIPPQPRTRLASKSMMPLGIAALIGGVAYAIKLRSMGGTEEE